MAQASPGLVALTILLAGLAAPGPAGAVERRAAGTAGRLGGGLSALASPDPWWDTSWLYRTKVSFDNAASDEDLIDFPVKVTLTGADLDFSKIAHQGADIRFVDDDGSPLPHEIEDWDHAAETANVWVRVQQLDRQSRADYVHLYYGNEAVSDGQAPAAVWNANFTGVWHLAAPDEQDSTLHVDSTAHDHHGAQAGNQSAAGAIGRGQQFDEEGGAAGDYIHAGTSPGGTPNLTVEFWMKTHTDSEWMRPLGKDAWSDPNDQGWSFLVRRAGDFGMHRAVIFRVGPANDYGIWGAEISAQRVYRANEWVHIVGTYARDLFNGGTGRLYANGVEVDSAWNIDGRGVANTAAPLLLGWTASEWGSDAEKFDGVLDECRISNVVRSADWIEASYLSQLADFAFATLGEEEAFDVVPPTLEVLRDGPSPTSATSVVFTIHFSESVRNVGADDFRLELSGVAASPTLILGDAGDLDESTYTVQVDAIVGSGTLGLRIADNTDIEDLGRLRLDPIPTVVEDYTIESLVGGIEISEGSVMSAGSGATVRFPHRLTNTHSSPTLVHPLAFSTCGLAVTYHADVDDDGTPDLYLGRDAEGNGRFDDFGDELSDAGDANEDLLLDVGPLSAGGTFDLILEQTFPDEECNPARLDVLVDGGSATNTVHLGTVDVFPDQERVAFSNDVVWFPHWVRNAVGLDQSIDLDTLSAFGWDYEFFLDPDRDGDPADAVGPLEDTDDSGFPDLALAAWESQAILIRGVVPPDAPIGLTETAVVRALVNGEARDTASNLATITSPAQLTPNHLIDLGTELHEGPGESAYFAHALINASGTPVPFGLSAVSDRGWTTELLHDPDGDGRPFDAVPLSLPTAPVPGNGGQLNLIVRVDVPLGEQTETSRIQVEATSPTTGVVLATAWDDLVATIVRLYEDPGHVQNINQTPPCTTLHALASGLQPRASIYRFTWHDDSGETVNIVNTTADDSGQCQASYSLGEGQQGEDWGVAIEEWDGLEWVSLDAADVDVIDPARVDALTTELPTYGIGATRLTATATLVNESFLLRPTDLQLRWVVLTPDRSMYLHESGEFRSVTGADATRLDVLPLLERSTSSSLELDVNSVAYIMEGSHALELWLSPSCGPERLVATTSFDIQPDDDHDGLSTADELLLSSDPHDADTDDDGLLDGEDGTTDTDGDGLIDALDCDSDNDGLIDGLEAGVEWPHADTDTLGCFVWDLSPSTTTDPDNPDTDGGGVPDGVEDDGNGRVDAGEGDPNDPLDDAAICAPQTPPELTSLAVNRSGDHALLSWQGLTLDPCMSYTVLATEALPSFSDLADRLTSPAHLDSAPLGATRLRRYLVRVDSLSGGPGPTGR